MNQINKVAIVGGTGKSGQYIVKLLATKGLRLKLLLRNPEKFLMEDSSIEIIKGDARNPDDIHKLLKSCDAVISTLGQPKGEPSIFSQATKNIISALEESGITRYILTTGLNVDTPSDKKGKKTKAATEWMKTNYPETTSDKQVEFDLLERSSIEWTLVRLPLIELTDERRMMLVSLEDCHGDKISATDLAYFIYELLLDESFIRQAPFIANQ